MKTLTIPPKNNCGNTLQKSSCGIEKAIVAMALKWFRKWSWKLFWNDVPKSLTLWECHTNKKTRGEILSDFTNILGKLKGWGGGGSQILGNGSSYAEKRGCSLFDEKHVPRIGLTPSFCAGRVPIPHPFSSRPLFVCKFSRKSTGLVPGSECEGQDGAPLCVSHDETGPKIRFYCAIQIKIIKIKLFWTWKVRAAQTIEYEKCSFYRKSRKIEENS